MMTLNRSFVFSALIATVTCMPWQRSNGQDAGGDEGSATQANQVETLFEKKTFTSPGGGELEYRIYTPDSAGEDAKLPLVLFLHGAGERGSDNSAQLKHGVTEFLKEGRGTRYPAILIAPQCPRDRKWVDADWSQSDGEGTFMSTPSPTMKLVFQLLDETIAGGQVDPSRLYVTGLSMGGYGSWYAAAEYRTMANRPTSGAPSDLDQATTSGFAAMIAICGGGDPSWVDRYDPVSIWAVHGDADRAVPVARSRSMIAALVNGGHPGEIRYTEHAGVGHDSWTQTYADEETYDWLFSQQR
ncbi:carboxylesterase family protein [Allorhodopirellula solitaria]|uniref:Prolyl oligopeptidase family protein n=1 Tax=Allorhodopirellula solitaria TaxID=2527987 RepID=A0A5C5WYK0_9BACT|nr:PHB depolymerase family esterase [Allorhodopirellula solitaria]TWT56044.1 Prolyl oligopeptidase family protein [Allorhodopirellula solitaria]